MVESRQLACSVTEFCAAVNSFRVMGKNPPSSDQQGSRWNSMAALRAWHAPIPKQQPGRAASQHHPDNMLGLRSPKIKNISTVH